MPAKHSSHDHPHHEEEPHTSKTPATPAPGQMMPPDPDLRIIKLSDAIAVAEGYTVADSRPQRNNNPGDLETDITGTGIGRDGPYIVYRTIDDGRAALRYLVLTMFNGHSPTYKPTMTIAEVAQHYSPDGHEAWAANVAKYLGVTVDTKLEDIH